MVILVLSLKVAPTDRKDVVNIFDTVAGSTSVKPGCKKVKLYSDINNDDDLLLVEEWVSKAELERHIGSDDFRKIMAIMDMAVKPPEMSFHIASSSLGFEFVEKIRARVNA